MFYDLLQIEIEKLRRKSIEEVIIKSRGYAQRINGFTPKEE